jgi:transposase-like protein
MTLADLPRENLGVDDQDVWENERTPTPVRCSAVRHHSMGLSVCGVEGVLAWLGVDRCYQAVWNWKEKLAETQSDPPTTEPSRVGVDGGKRWLYAAIDTESKLLLGVDVYNRRGTDRRQRFSIASPRNTMSPIQSFSLMTQAI